MRELTAGLIALVLLLVALSMATALHFYRKRREAVREAARVHGQAVIAEIPGGADLDLFAEDRVRFYYANQAIEKEYIQAVHLLINGASLAQYVSSAAASPQPRATGDDRLRTDRLNLKAHSTGEADAAGDQPGGIERDRWDVLIETVQGDTLIACGSIRERVSQELARKIYNAVKSAMEYRDHHSVSADPAR